MKKNIIRLCFLSVSLALCLILSLGLIFAGPAEAGANEQLSDFPALLTAEGNLNLQFPDGLSRWLQDHFFLRQELISLEHWLDAKLFRTSGDPGVVLGSDGWLYYTDTVADYTGTDPMTAGEIFAAAKNLSLMDRYCRENGRQFLFVIAPNKNSLYGENMPDYGVKAAESDANRLLERLEELGVNTVDLFSAFAEEEETLYFAHDSHWNTRGAALGADLINGAFGNPTDYFSGDFSATEPHQGDLYTMLYPAFDDPEENPVYGGALDYTFTTGATRPDAIVLQTESNRLGSLLAYRDSFGNLLFPFLADSYGTCRFARSPAYDLTQPGEKVLVELVERNLRNLTNNLPVMPAPAAEVKAPATVSGTLTVTSGEKNGMLRLEGQLPDPDETSPVYILDGEQAWEAFRLGESGFGLYLPVNAEPKFVMFQAQGVWVQYEIQES